MAILYRLRGLKYSTVLIIIMLSVVIFYKTSDYQHPIKSTKPPQENESVPNRSDEPSKDRVQVGLNGTTYNISSSMEVSFGMGVGGMHIDTWKKMGHEASKYLIREMQKNTIEEWIQELTNTQIVVQFEMEKMILLLMLVSMMTTIVFNASRKSIGSSSTAKNELAVSNEV